MPMFRSVFIVLLAFSAAAHLATAETMAVCTKGCDCTSVNAAIAVVVPCHRVIGSDGQLRGFKWVISRKAEFLRREGREEQRDA